MSFGYDREPNIFLNDTQRITAFLRDDSENLILQANIQAAKFTVLGPTDTIAAPSVNAEDGTITGDGTAIFDVAASIHAAVGQYKAICQFTFNSTQKKSVPVDYEVIDPFERVGPQVWDGAVDVCWRKLEDCFDSEMGGPWLRDMTMARFDKDRISQFLDDVVFEINMQQPQTSYTKDNFPYNLPDGVPLVGQGLLLHTVRHLMRAYTEQPDQANSPVGFFDRTKYQQAWGNIYTLELDRWLKWLGAYKLRLYNASGTKMLVASKAGRLLPAPLRSRNVGRGWY